MTRTIKQGEERRRVKRDKKNHTAGQIGQSSQVIKKKPTTVGSEDCCRRSESESHNPVTERTPHPKLTAFSRFRDWSMSDDPSPPKWWIIGIWMETCQLCHPQVAVENKMMHRLCSAWVTIMNEQWTNGSFNSLDLFLFYSQTIKGHIPCLTRPPTGPSVQIYYCTVF